MMKSRSRNKEKKAKVSVRYYRIPESLSALLRMVSFTAAKTNRMFDVSVACVRLGDEYQFVDGGVAHSDCCKTYCG